MTSNGKHPVGRAALSLLLSFAMAWGMVPAPAIAEMVDEAAVPAGGQAAGPEGSEPRIEPAAGQPQEDQLAELTTEAVRVAGDPSAEDDGDELLAGYVQRMLDEPLPEGAAREAGFSLTTQSAQQGLSGSNLAIYNALRARAEAVAAGKKTAEGVTETSTSVTIACSSLPEPYAPTQAWTAADLGLGSLEGNAMFDAALGKMGIDTGLIYSALVADCPYDLYWFDKTDAGLGMSARYASGTVGGQDVVSFVNGSLTFNMYVLPKYSASEVPRTTTVREGIVSSVSAAVATAQSIVSDPAKASMTVPERLAAYKDAICGLVAYDQGATAQGASAIDGGPWQLVYVFDGNEDTNVVCEGYSKAFKYLCDLTWTSESGVECLIATGAMDGGTGAGDHMWNVVRLDDGKSYLVDVTNCDQGTVGAPDKLFMAYGPSGSWDGTYTFRTNGQSVGYAYDDHTKTLHGKAALTISATAYAGPVHTPVEVPTAAEGLVYDGTEQVGVASAEGYAVSGGAATNAGDYTATATLAAGYEWPDGTTAPKDISWSIARKPVTVTADNKTKVTGETDPELTATVAGTVGDEAVAYSLSRAEGDEAGMYDITATGDAEQGNYAVTFVPGKLMITAPGQEVIAFGTWGTCPWEITSDGTLTVHPGAGANQSGTSSPWSAYSESITSVVFAADGSNKVMLPNSSGYLFYELPNVATMDLAGVDAQSLHDAQSMFANCMSLTSIEGISGWDTRNLESIKYIFSGCSKLRVLDLSNWNVSSLSSLGNAAFRNCSSLEFIDLSGWDTKNKSVATDDTWRDFYGCSSLSVFKIGANYQINPATRPYNRSTWWSVKDQKWYSTDSIKSADDTYTSYEVVGYTDISDATITFEQNELVYTSMPIEPIPKVVIGERTLVSGTDYVCTYANNTEVGTATVTIQGTGRYGVGYFGTVTRDFTINKATLTVRANERVIFYGDAPTNNGVVYEGFLGDDTVASLGGTIQYQYNYQQFGNAGDTYSITPSGLTSDNYDLVYVPGVLRVRQKQVDLSWSDTSFTYDASPHVPTATAGGLINGDVVTVTVEGAQTNAGTHTATAKSLSNANYCLPSEKTCAFTIAKAAISPTASLTGWTYGEPANAPSVAGNPGGGEVSYRFGRAGSPVVEHTGTVPTEAGAYVVRAIVAETGNYLGGEAATQFTIAKAASSVTTSPAACELSYTGSPQALVTAGVATGGAMRYSVDGGTAWSADVPKATAAGEYKVLYKVVGDANHEDAAAAGPIAVTIARAGNSLVVGGGQTVEAGGKLDLSELVTGAIGGVAYAISTPLDGCSVDGSSGLFTAGTVAGTCVVSVSAAGDGNHESATKTLTVTVLPSVKDATISFQNQADASVEYDGVAKTPAVTVVHSGQTLTADDYSVEYLNNTNAGTATVRITGRGNFVGVQEKTFTINKRVATVTARDASKAYGTKDPTFSANVTGTVNGDTLSYTVARDSGEGLGEYAIKPTGATEQGNYAVTYQNGIFTISQNTVANAQATFARQTYTGKALTPKPTSVVADGRMLVAGVDYEVGTYANNTDAGIASVVIIGKGGYADTKNVSFRIEPAPVTTLSLSPTSAVYDGKAKTPAATVKAGSLSVPASGYSISYANNTNAGTATVTVTGRGNYTGTKSATFRISPAAITSVSVSPASYSYDGKAKTPAVTVKAGSATVPASGYSVSYANNVDPGTATVTVTGRGNYTGAKSATFAISAPAAAHVAYRTHVQSFGWQPYVRDGAMSGTSGKAKRLEGINIRLEGAHLPGSIEYRTHVQKIGWQGYMRDGAMSGTSGRALRLEAIQIRLTGQMAERYDVWYRVHAQTYGWMGWAKNDSPAGTAGYAKRLEGIEVRVLPKGSAAPGSQSGAFVTKDGSSPAQSYAGHQVSYRTHVQSFGWRSYVCDGQMSGTTGLAKRLEGINIRLINQQAPGSIEYRTHVQSYGWMPYVKDGAMSGTSGQAKRLEAIQIRLTGQMAQRFDVWYRVHAQTFGWMGWAKNDQQAGTAGWAKRLECLEIVVLPKGSPAPGSTANAFRRR